MEYEDIIEYYQYDEISKKAVVRFFPDDSIATVTRTTDDYGEEIEPEVMWEGMTRKEIEEYFPSRTGDEFNLALLIRSIIYEAYKKEGEDIEAGNVRRFWYTHLKNIITKKLGLQVTDSIDVAINTAWGVMINSGLVTYEGMNIRGGKESTRKSVVKDSPFNHIIIAVEKADYFEDFKWLPELFNCTLITAGGQPSRAVARAFIKELDDLGVNLDQQFFMCVASDLDPAGYYIQEAFRKQFESAIEYYGGSGSVETERLFVRKNQVSQGLLMSEAIPCRDKAKSVKSRKAEDTKWKFFCEQTGGGLYINKPPGWTGRTEIIDGKEMVRALLEMNAFSNTIIEKSIIKELLKIIEETSDESKIMICEIMRIFEKMRSEAIEEVYQEWHKKIIQPLIDIFLKDTMEWELQISRTFRQEKKEAEDERDEAIEDIEEQYDEQIEEQEDQAREEVPELYEQKGELEIEIEKLQEQLQEVNDEIIYSCPYIFNRIKELEDEKEAETDRIINEYEEKISELRKQRNFRTSRLDLFKDEHSTVFNPMEMSLKDDITEALSPEEIEYYFHQIEQMDRFQPHIGKMLSNPDLLSENHISCFDQPVPTFQEEDLLQKASLKHQKNIGNVRKAFPEVFTNEMKILIKEHSEGMVFELDGVIEQIDLSDKVKKAIDETEDEIEDGSWKE